MLTKHQIINSIVAIKENEPDYSNSYMSVLMKMKKGELEKMLEDLQKNNDNSDSESDDELIDQYDKIKYEVSKLEQRNKSNQSKLVELTDSESDDDSSDDEPAEKQTAEEQKEETPVDDQEEETPVNDQEEMPVDKTKTDNDSDTEDEDDEKVSDEVEAIIKDYENKKQLKKYQKEIRAMLREFKDNVHMMLLEYNDYEFLSDDDVADIWQYFDELHDVVVHNLKSIYEEMSDDIDFDETFYKSIDKTFTDTKKKINKFISD